MDTPEDYLSLISGARRGERACAEGLAVLVRDRLQSHIGRITLDEDLTEDILQETVIEMFRFLDKLEKLDRFWPWLFRIAGNNAKDAMKARRRYQKHLDKGGRSAGGDGKGGLEQLIGAELRQTVSAAMKALKPEHRQVISLRCYEELPYSDIAGIMGKSEFASRVLFVRAKKSLARQLARRGLAKGALILALGLFGEMTARSQAAAAKVSVTASTLKVGWSASMAGALMSKTAVVTALSMGVATGAFLTGPLGHNATGDKASLIQETTAGRVQYGTAGQAWYYLPKGPSGPVMLRLADYDCRCGGRCGWLRNERGNYCYHESRNTTRIENYCYWNYDGSVMRLPTDEPEFLEFLTTMDGRVMRACLMESPLHDAFIIVRSDQQADSVQSMQHYNALSEEQFRADWPADAVIVDGRDEMHRRGWTFFKISGNVNGKRFTGHGRIPFVCATAQTFYPWLRLQIADTVQIEDIPTGARVINPSGQVLSIAPGGYSFAGFSRPWMGLHTIDTVRRDAAHEQIPFETDYKLDSPLAKVTLHGDSIRLVYTIDMENDLLREISFTKSDGRELGRLTVSYLDQAESSTAGFEPPPAFHSPVSEPRPGSGIQWLLRIGKGLEPSGTLK